MRIRGLHGLIGVAIVFAGCAQQATRPPAVSGGSPESNTGSSAGTGTPAGVAAGAGATAGASATGTGATGTGTAGTGAAGSGAAGTGAVTTQMRSGSLELRKYQIDDWIAPDDRTLVINGADRSLYEARFKSRCTGLRDADTIAFIVPGALQVEQYSGVVLPGGTHCNFASVTRLSTSPGANHNGSPASQ